MIKIFANSFIKYATKPGLISLASVHRNFSTSTYDSKENPIHQGLELQKEADKYLDKFEFKEALSRANHACEMMEKSFGQDHTYTAEALIKSSQICNILGYWEKAYANSTQAVDILKNYPDIHRPILASALSTLSESLVNVGSYPESLKAGKEAYELYRQMFGKHNVQTMNSRINLGDRYRLVGNLDKAEEILNQCLKDYDPTEQFSELRRATPYLPLVALSLEKRDFDQAHHYIAQEISELEKLNQKKLPVWGRVYNLLGDLELKEKDYKDALISLQDAFDFYNEVFDGMHPEVSETLTNMAKCYLEAGDAEKAKDTQQKAIDIFKHFIADVTHPQYLIMNICLGMSMRNSDDKIGAQKLIEKSLKELSLKLGSQHPKTILYTQLAANYDTEQKMI